MVERATRTQLQCNRLAHLYGRRIEIEKLDPGVPFVMLDLNGVWLRGRQGVLPTRRSFDSKWIRFVVSPETAAALIKRDSGSA